jgi:hypothetical protein
MAVEGEQARLPKGSPYDHGGGWLAVWGRQRRGRGTQFSGLDLSAGT